MAQEEQISLFIKTFVDCFSEGRLIKVTLGKPVKKQDDLKNVYLRPVEIKGQTLLQAVYRYQNRDITKNHDVAEVEKLLNEYLDGVFLQANLFALNEDLQLMISKKGKARLITGRPTQSPLQELSHDHVKSRPIETQGKVWLRELGITNSSFGVLPKMQDKYRQINKYIEIIDTIIPESVKGKEFTAVDMGSGKGYLTFALYDHLINNRNLDASVTGVEIRRELVDFCNRVAKTSGFKGLHFETGSIEEFTPKKVDMLIALHACDTATDEAIFKGIQSNAPVIVVAPCCHKQVRKSMEPANELSSVLKHGIFMERQAELLTDGLRLLYLELYGYKTKALEFISSEHTPKNVMIIAQKTGKNVDKAAVFQQIQKIRESFGIDYHYLEVLLNSI